MTIVVTTADGRRRHFATDEAYLAWHHDDAPTEPYAVAVIEAAPAPDHEHPSPRAQARTTPPRPASAASRARGEPSHQRSRGTAPPVQRRPSPG